MQSLRLYGVSLVFAATCMGGCGSFGETSIYRHIDLNAPEHKPSIVLDAKQRVVTNVPGRSDENFVGRQNPLRIICAEPSPDVANAISQALKATLDTLIQKGEVKGEISGTYARSATESVAQLGQRIATIQLLRDELSDLCRSYANGAVSSTTYTLRLSRLDKKMVTLLVSEASAGVLGRGSVGISDGGREANISSKESIDRARQELFAAAIALRDAQEVERKEGKSENRENVSAKSREFERKISALYAVERLAAGPPRVSEGSSISDGSITASSDNFAELQRQFLDKDEVGTLLDACITSMDTLVVPKPEDRAAIYQNALKLEGDYGAPASELRRVEVALKHAENSLTAMKVDAANTDQEIRRTAGKVRDQKFLVAQIQIEIEFAKTKLQQLEKERTHNESELEHAVRMLYLADRRAKKIFVPRVLTVEEIRELEAIERDESLPIKLKEKETYSNSQLTLLRAKGVELAYQISTTQAKLLHEQEQQKSYEEELQRAQSRATTIENKLQEANVQIRKVNEEYGSALQAEAKLKGQVEAARKQVNAIDNEKPPISALGRYCSDPGMKAIEEMIKTQAEHRIKMMYMQRDAKMARTTLAVIQLCGALWQNEPKDSSEQLRKFCSSVIEDEKNAGNR